MAYAPHASTRKACNACAMQQPARKMHASMPAHPDVLGLCWNGAGRRFGTWRRLPPPTPPLPPTPPRPPKTGRTAQSATAPPAPACLAHLDACPQLADQHLPVLRARDEVQHAAQQHKRGAHHAPAVLHRHHVGLRPLQVQGGRGPGGGEGRLATRVGEGASAAVMARLCVCPRSASPTQRVRTRSGRLAWLAASPDGGGDPPA